MALAVLPLAACSDDEPAPSPFGSEEAALRDIERTLGERVAAVAEEDRTAFLAGVATDDVRFRNDQSEWFDAMDDLPVAELGYTPLPDTLKRIQNTERYWVDVEISLQLEGIDAAPVVSHDRYLFVPSPDSTRYLLASTEDRRWEETRLTGAQPWDLDNVDVEDSSGVVGVFDDVTRADGDDIVDAVVTARYDVDDVIPVGVPDDLLVYGLSDPTFVTGIATLAVADPAQVDAVTVPVPEHIDEPSGPAASYRILLGADALAASPSERARLIRHELTHVALGDRARDVPLWLTEGVAEYVSVQAMPRSARRIPSTALTLAGALTDLPQDVDFAGTEAQAWYAVAWWICEAIARDRGEDALWWLIEEFHGGAQADELLDRVLGTTSEELAREGARLMLDTYSG